MAKKPNKYFAPLAIAGMTIGLLATAYKFVFAKPKNKSSAEQKNIVKDEHVKNEQVDP